MICQMCNESEATAFADCYECFAEESVTLCEDCQWRSEYQEEPAVCEDCQ